MAIGPGDLTGRRVLIVEDESMVAMLLQDTLTDIGCEVVAIASRFDDAMEKATALSFDVAILDVNLNGRNTFAIAESLHARGIAVLFATGYGAAGLPPSLQSSVVLRKPFRQRDLERALQAALS